MDEKLIKSIDEFIRLNYTGDDVSSYIRYGVCNESLDYDVDIKASVHYSKEKVVLDSVGAKDSRKKKHEIEVIYCKEYNDFSIDDAKEVMRKIKLDESFSEMVLRKIDEKHMSDVECYSRANIDRRHFSKIRSDKNYRPSKQTALSLAISLELAPKEKDDLLKKADYALSNSNRSDIIVKYFIKNKVYDLSQIDQMLLYYDLKPLRNY